MSMQSTVKAGETEWIKFELDQNNSKITLIDSPTIEYSYTLSVFASNIIGSLGVYSESRLMLISAGYLSRPKIDIGKLFNDADSSAILLELNLIPMGNIDDNATIEIYAKGEYQFKRKMIHHPILIGHSSGQDLTDLFILLVGSALLIASFSLLFLKYVKIGKILKSVKR